MKYFFGSNVDTFGEPVYWSRLLHGMLYLLFSFLWFTRIPLSYIVLLIDVIIGFLTFVMQYSRV